MEKVKLMNRIDTKFLTTKEDALKVLECIQNDYFIQEITNKLITRYRTVYWDSDEHQFYLMHQNGHTPRVKVRIRTYEDSVGLTFLEIKRKDNHGKTHKKRIRIQSETEPEKSGGDEFLFGKMGIHIQDLHPCLQNHFKRITLVNKAMTERLTMDFDIAYTNLETQKEADSGNLVVVELKRNDMALSPIHDVLSEQHIRPHGYSKYVIGSYQTNPSLKHNLIKPKYNLIQKIMM